MSRCRRRKPGPNDWEIRIRRRARREKWTPFHVVFPMKTLNGV